MATRNKSEKCDISNFYKNHAKFEVRVMTEKIMKISWKGIGGSGCSFEI